MKTDSHLVNKIKMETSNNQKIENYFVSTQKAISEIPIHTKKHDTGKLYCQQNTIKQQ